LEENNRDNKENHGDSQQGTGEDQEDIRNVLMYGLPPFYDDWEGYLVREKTEKQMIYEVYQAVVGIDRNPEDNGILGDVKDIKAHLVKLNDQVGKNTMFRKIGTWLTGIMIVALVNILIKLFWG